MIDFLTNASANILNGYNRILLQPLNEKEEGPISFSHFIPINQWDEKGFTFVDRGNQDVYVHDSQKVKRLKCLALTAATPLIQAVALLLNLANRVAKIVTLAHFWYPTSTEFTLKERSFELLKDLLRVALTPIFYLGLVLSAIYGIALPYDGGKLYATFERCAYKGPFLAPCFQPFATFHLGGGDIHLPNQW